MISLLTLALLGQVATGGNASVDTGGPSFGFGAYDSRDQSTQLQVLVNKIGVTYAVTDPCGQVGGIVGGLVGPTAFCLKPDGTSAGTQVDGGPLVAFVAGTITPATVTASRCPNGPECDAVTFSRMDGGTGNQWLSANTASIEGDLSCAFMARRLGASATQYPLTKWAGTGPAHTYLSSTTATVSVFGLDAGTTVVSSAANTQIFGAWETYGFTYDYAADLDSDLTLYAAGSASGTPSAVAVGPLRTTATPWRISGFSAMAGFLDGDVLFAACSEDAWTAAEHLAIARAMRANWSGMYGEAITFTRASTAYCDPLDGGYGTWLRNNEACLVGGTYLSEPAATNRALYSNALDTAATWVPLGAIGDGGTASTMVPVVTANSTDVVDPAGTYTAEKIAFPAVVWAGDASALQQAWTGTAVAWSGRVYKLRTLTGTATVYLYAYTGAAAPPTNALATCSVTTAWTECKWLGATLTAATYQYSLGVDLRATIGTGQSAQAAQTIYAYQAQAELGSVATSPIENAGTALTRAATLATVPNPLSGVNPSAWCMGGTLHPDFAAWASYSTPVIVSVGTWTGANSAGVYINGTTGKPIFTVYDNAAGSKYVVATSALAFPSSPNWPSVFGCNNNGTLSIWVNGAQVATDAPVGAGTGIVTTQPTTIYLGALSTGFQPNGYVSAWRAFTGEFRQ